MNNYKKIISLMNKINSSITLQALLSTIIDSAKDILNCEGSSLLLHDMENEELIFDIVISDKGEIIQGKRLKIGEGIAGYVAGEKKGLIVNDVSTDERFYTTIDKLSGFVTRNIAAVPVSIKSKFIGVLEVVNSREKDGYTQKDMELLEYLADAAAIAVNNHELVINLRNRVEELTCIYEISQSIYFTFDVDEFLLKILNAVNKVIRARRCSFLILDEDGKEVKHFISTENEVYKIDLENTMMSQVIKSGDPLLVYNIDNNNNCLSLNSHKKESNGYRSKSFICVPMKLRDRVIGVLNVTDKNMEGTFDSFDLRVLSTIANQVAETYENVLLQKIGYAKDRLDQELKIAANIQSSSFSMVPDNIPGAEIGAFNIPSSFVSGDFFEIIPLGDTEFSCCVGDVSGKGISAAMYMNTVRNALRFESVRAKDPVEIISLVNNWAYRESHSGMFCTFFYCLADTAAKTLQYCSAGHNPQLYYDSEKEVFELISTHGKPLGIIETQVLEVRERKYNSGDLLVLFSDGLSEQSDEGEIAFEEFVNIMKGSVSKNASDITEQIRKILLDGAGGNNLSDDCTLLVVRFT